MGKGKTGFSRFFAVCYFRRFSFGKESVREKFGKIAKNFNSRFAIN